MSDEPQQTHDVFISYSSKDKKWADAACAVLEKRRIRCWVAPRDITPGTEWGAAIIKGMDASKIMVLIFSTHANESSQVRREVERAISKGLIVLPFRVENINPAGAMEYALSNTHWLDGFTKPVERQFDLLAKSVASLLAREPEEVAEPPMPTMPSSRRPYARLAIGGVVAVLAMIGVGALVGMFRGGGVQSQPNVAPSLTPNAPLVQNGGKAASFEKQKDQGRRKTHVTDDERLQGRWEVVNTSTSAAVAKQSTKQRGAGNTKQTAKRKGVGAPDPRNDKLAWVFEGPNLTIRRTIDGEEQDWVRGTFTLRTVGDRKLIDYDSEAVNGRKIEWRGIYGFDGQFLEVCWRPKTESTKKLFDRPNSFIVDENNQGTYTKLGRPGRG